MPATKHKVRILDTDTFYTRDRVPLSPLEVFVESGGRDLPASIMDWDRNYMFPDENNFKARTCAMCRSNDIHHPYIVHMIYIDNPTRDMDLSDSIAVAVCENCDYEMELAQTIELRNRNINEDYTEEKYWQNNHAKKMIERYNDVGELPRNKIPNTGRCFFCEKTLEDEPPIEMFLPVSGESDSYGVQDLAHVCADCFHESGYNLERHFVAVDRCMNCAVSYPIDDNELDYRTTQKSYGQHLCPTCYMMRHGTNMHNRFIYYPCKECQNTEIVDRSTVREQGSLPDLYNFTCKRCLNRKYEMEETLALDNPLGDDSIAVQWDENNKIVAFEARDNPGKLMYVILMRKPVAGDNMWSIKYSPTTTFDNVFDTISAGLNKCEEIC